MTLTRPRGVAGVENVTPAEAPDECTFPTTEHHHRLNCGRRVAAVYVLAAGRILPRCARHDGPNTRRQAEAMGAHRIPIEAWQP